MAWLDDATTYVAAQLSGYTVGTNVFKTFLPDAPDAAIALYNAGGATTPDGNCLPREDVVLEVRVRAATHAACQTLMSSVLALFAFKNNLTMSSTVVNWCRQDSEPNVLEVDQHKRPVMLLRVAMNIRRTDNY